MLKENIHITHKDYEGRIVTRNTVSSRSVTGDPLTDLDAPFSVILRRANVNLDRAREAQIYIVVADGEEAKRDAA